MPHTASIVIFLTAVALTSTPSHPDTTLFSRSLSGADGPREIAVWEGAFAPGDHGIMPIRSSRCIAVPPGMGQLTQCRLSAVVRPVRRSRSGGWALAGLSIVNDTDTRWSLHLVEGPEMDHRFELLEDYHGIHQARYIGRTKLDITVDQAPGDWEYGSDYLLEIDFCEDYIEGRATQLPAGDLLYRRRLEFAPDSVYVTKGTPAIWCNGLSAAFRNMRVEGDSADAPPPPVTSQQRKVVAVLNQPAIPSAFSHALDRALEETGFTPKTIGADQLADPAAMEASGAGMLLLPWAPAFPTRCTDGLLAFLRRGGYMAAVGGTLGNETVARARRLIADGEQMARRAPPTGTLLDMSLLDEADFSRAASNAEADSHLQLVSGPEHIGTAAEITYEGFRNWDNYFVPVTATPRQPQMLVIFSARGGGNTEWLTVELDEADTSRWIAQVPLTDHWQTYALLPQQFPFWGDSDAVGRGDARDYVHLDRATRVSIGLANMRGKDLPPGQHHVWVGSIKYAPIPDEVKALSWTPPVIETISPEYKTYLLQDVDTLQPAPAHGDLLKIPAGVSPLDIRSPIARSLAAGFYPAAPYRWIPLIEGHNEAGGEATLAAVFAPTMGRMANARWATIGIADRSHLDHHASAAADLVALVLERLAAPVMLRRGGLNQASCVVDNDGAPEGFDTDPVIGAEIENVTDKPIEVSVRVSIVPDGAKQAATSLAQWSLDVRPGDSTSIQRPLTRLQREPGFYTILTQLRSGGRVVDRIAQPISLIAPPDAKHDDMIQVSDGDFVLAGEKWHPHGINFWPRYVSGTEKGEYGKHWLTPEFYNPAEIEEDLRIAGEIGLNVLSIQYGGPEQASSLNDFLARCRRHRIRAYIYVGGFHPLSGAIAEGNKLIKLARLTRNPTVFAYDIAWEPHWGKYPQRRNHRKQWQRWVINQYGSIEAAEEDWGYPIPRGEDGAIDVPSDRQIQVDGDWLVMSAAYSRFLDDLIGRKWMQQTKLIRQADPNHLLSFRAAGQPSWMWWASYDMRAAGPFVDFLGPEGYGLKPHEAGFTTHYARWAGNGKPVWWAEFGTSVGIDPTPQDLQRQGELWQGFLQMAIDSRANGTCGWWFPGGYRTGERSDFGVIDPSGIPRPAALQLKQFADLFADPPPPREDSVTVTIDRDRHASNYRGVYDAHKGDWVAANAAGKRLEVVTPATGTTSENVPLVAVGNRPYNGNNPPKYLNALFEELQIRTRGGEWVTVEDRSTVEMPAGVPLQVRAVVVNTSEPLWLARDGVGQVALAAGQRRGLNFYAPIPRDVERHQRVAIGPTTLTEGIRRETSVVFAMQCADRAWFGQRIEVTLKPRN